VLCYVYAHEQIAGYVGNLVKDFSEPVKLGVVQTAYANGSSTRYINDVLVRFLCPIIKRFAVCYRSHFIDEFVHFSVFFL